MDTHLISRDFIADEVESALPGRSKDLYGYLARSKNGQDLWEQMFDGDQFNNLPVSPEILNAYLKQALPVR